MKFHNKKLALLWQHDLLASASKRKPIDGQFIFSSLFSVYAFSTKNDHTLPTVFAKKVIEKVGDDLRAFRLSIKKNTAQFKESIDPIELRVFEPSNQYALNLVQDKLSPQNTMLVKIFLATDAFIIELNKALFNGELNKEQKQAYQNGALNDLTALLMKLNKTCIEFHQLRKTQLEKG
ncbi:hypothetical protein [Aliivibrio salmonicida]|uniref:hypothetical protein n=1 Tax=Aliivibrio salmonicida TaxID=40269 RepID=UPI003D127FA8